LIFRFILANTEQLHDKIVELSERVRQLEDALGDLASDASHPLLAPELLKIKTFQDLYGVAISPRSTQTYIPTASSSDHQTKEEQLRQSLNSLSSLSLNCQPPYAEISRPHDYLRTSTLPEIGADILQLSATFPFPWAVDVSIRKRIRDTLPPKDEATRVCHEARNNALWQYVSPSLRFRAPSSLNLA
jgi:hypothetical protein